MTLAASPLRGPGHPPARPVETPRLRVLDACLTFLEEASERGLQRVSARLAGRLPCEVPGLVPGILTRDAIELVFHEQERCLESRQAAAPASHAGPPLGRVEARSLTDRIRRSRGDQSLLMLEAHGRRAWRALGYRSWESYVREELGLSRSRSYELLDHGRVVGRLKAALQIDVAPDITPAAAARIAPRLPEVIAELRGRLGQAPPELEVRRAVRQMAEKPVVVGRTELDALLDRLLRLPAPAELAQHLAPDPDRSRRLREAMTRLGELAEVLEQSVRKTGQITSAEERW